MNSITIRQSVEENPDFEDFWKIYPKRPGDNKKQALRQWQARLKAGVNPLAILDGTRRYANYCKEAKIEPQFVKMAATFIGRDEHYLSVWIVPQLGKSASFDQWLTGKSGDEDGIIDI